MIKSEPSQSVVDLIPSKSSKYHDSNSTELSDATVRTKSKMNSKLVSPSKSLIDLKSGDTDTVMNSSYTIDLTKEPLYDEQQANSSIPIMIGKAFFFNSYVILFALL